jgi:hypothetical protein
MVTEKKDSKVWQHPHTVWLYAVAAVVAVVLLITVGIVLVHGNADIACTQTIQNGEGLCTGGSWSPWATLSQATSSTGEVVANQQRIYTGLRASVAGNLSYTTGTAGHPDCSINLANSVIHGTVITTYATCQVQETQSIVLKAGANAGSTGGGASAGTVLDFQQTTTVGAVSTTTSSAFSGSYQQYLDAANTALAVTDISAIPTLVRAGDITHIVWRSSHVASCQVTGTNGDSWTGLASSAQGATSTPINQQVIYTLACVTSGGTSVPQQQVTINIIPAYQER